MNISADPVLWTPVLRDLSSKSGLTPKDTMTKRFSDVRKILMDDWDPIGVREAIEARDEYDDYVSQVISMVSEGASTEDITEHLMMVMRDLIGIPPNHEISQKAASKILGVLKIQ